MSDGVIHFKRRGTLDASCRLRFKLCCCVLFVWFLALACILNRPDVAAQCADGCLLARAWLFEFRAQGRVDVTRSQRLTVAQAAHWVAAHVSGF